jgi:ABC-type phosphate transport system permease subunit
MKWLYKVLFTFLLLLFLLLSSCCGSKRSRTMTETTTVTKVDTIIKVVKDTVEKTVFSTLYDTAHIENETAVARAFYNVKTQRIELSLKGKIFDVPVQLQRTQYIRQKEVIRETTLGMWFYLLVVLLIFLFGIVITKKFQKLCQE